MSSLNPPAEFSQSESVSSVPVKSMRMQRAHCNTRCWVCSASAKTESRNKDTEVVPWDWLAEWGYRVTPDLSCPQECCRAGVCIAPAKLQMYVMYVFLKAPPLPQYSKKVPSFSLSNPLFFWSSSSDFHKVYQVRQRTAIVVL